MRVAGIITQTRHSKWCSNLVIVRKNNGTIRLCVNLRNINLACKKDNYPLSNMETLLQRVTGSGMISLLDGFSGYNQVWVKKEDCHKTTFTTPWGNFEYIRMSFGLTTTMLEIILRGRVNQYYLINKIFSFPYLDPYMLLQLSEPACICNCV